MRGHGPIVYPVDDLQRRSPLISRITAPALLGAIIGFLAWPHAIWLAPVALLLLSVVNRSHWLGPFLLMLGYHLATTWGLIRGTAVFFPHAGTALGLAFWSLSSLAFALPYLAYPYLVLYFRGGGFGAVVATLVTSSVSTILPPLGIVGWTSPWIGALPFGWVGIVLILWMIFWVNQYREDDALARLGVAIGFWVLFALSVWSGIFPSTLRTLPRPPAGWVGIDTRLGHLSSTVSYVEASMDLVPKVLADLRAGDKLVLLPETVAGPWLPGTRAVWRPVIRWTRRHPGQTVLLGAAVPHGSGYLDALVQIADGRQTILPDHIPVPFSMWHPWRRHGNFRMAPFSRKPESTEIDHRKAGYLICYEQLLMWPALDLYPQGIQILLAPANDWWARGTDIPAIQRASARAWAAFFGVPVIFAVNR
jgi:hypothetical protein